MGGLDGVWAAVLPAADRPHPCTFSFTRRGTSLLTNLTVCFFFPSIRHELDVNANASATQICTCHQLLHPQVLQLLIKLFETEHSQLDVMEQVGFICFQQKFSETARLLGSLHACFIVHPQLELKKTLLDRMVHLLSRGYVLPVVSYIRKCLEKLNTDISLIRYFVTEVKAAYHLEDKKKTKTQWQDWMLDLSKLPFCWMCW